MAERRYTEDETAEIFKYASESQQSARRPLAPGEGMTLADLHAIGREVGIPPELVTQAARALELRPAAETRRLLGLPIGVGRTIHFGRFLSDEEWERLVIDLRTTFGARGVVRHDGSFRQWTNGNLQALLEPTPTGHQLRLSSVKGESRRMIRVGLVMMSVAAVGALARFATGGLADMQAALPVFGAVGAFMFGAGALRLPGWAKLRGRQMEGVAARAALADTTAGAEDSALPPST